MRENFELHIDTSPQINHLNGRFIKGHVPFNKGKKWVDYMDMRKARKVIKCLELGRMKGNRDKLHELNRIPIVGIKDGILYPFESSIDAARILRAKGIRVNARNIRAVCRERITIVAGREYIRRHAGGFRWFIASEVEKYKEFLK